MNHIVKYYAPDFYLLQNVPEESHFMEVINEGFPTRYNINRAKFNEAMKACEASKMKIVNSDVVAIEMAHSWYTRKSNLNDCPGRELKDGDSFPLPEWITFKEEIDTCKNDGLGSCGCQVHETKFMHLECKATGKKFIRLTDSSKKVKEETQEEIFTSLMEELNDMGNFHDSIKVRRMLKYFTIQRKKP